MANGKKCSCCNEVKPTTDYWKFKRAKDGLQSYCKTCGFSKSIKLTKAGTTGSVYKISNQEGFTYVGKTFKKLKYRFSLHISESKNSHKYNYRGECAPLLMASFRKYGIDAHTFELVNEYPNISKEDLRQHERNLIQIYKQNNKSLNTND